MRIRSKGYKRPPFSEEWKNNMRLYHLGKHSNALGKHWKLSKKTKEKQSQANKRRIVEGKHNWAVKGENHPNWIKDRSKLKLCSGRKEDFNYMMWAALVKKRDAYKCKIKNIDCKGRVEAHHILRWHDYPELRYDINNGITLCHTHHPRKKDEENRLSPYFKELINCDRDVNKLEKVDYQD